MKKRIFCLIMAFITIVSSVVLVSCGVKKTANTGVSLDKSPESLYKEAPDHVKKNRPLLTTKNLGGMYSGKNISILDTELENIQVNSAMQLDGDKFLFQGYDTKYYENHSYVVTLDENVITDVKEIELTDRSDESKSEYLNAISSDGNGNLWIIKLVTYQSGNVEYPIADDDMAVLYGSRKLVVSNGVYEAYDGKYAEPEQKLLLEKLDASGNVIGNTDITAAAMIEYENGSTYMGYASGIYFVQVDGAKKVLVPMNSDSFLIIDAESFEFEGKTTLEEGTYIDGSFVGASGTFYYTSWTDTGMAVTAFDFASGKGKAIELPVDENRMYEYRFAEGKLGYELLLSNSTGLYGFNPGDSQITEICNYINSDLDLGYSYSVPIVLDSGELFLCYYDYNNAENVLLRLQAINPDEIAEKYVITVAGEGIPSDVKSEFIKFNRTNSKYKIVFKDYSIYNTEENEWTGGIDKLEEDIVNNKNGIDIVLFYSGNYYGENGFDYESLIQKSAFVDLNELISQDKSFSKKDYLENVFNALETNGGLYMVTPTVSFQTLAMKKSEAESIGTWNAKAFREMHKSLGEGEYMYREPTRDNFGKQLLSICVETYVDKETGECNFDNVNFKSILEYLRDIPDNYEGYSDLWEDDSYWQEYEMAYFNGSTKLYPVYINNFDMIPEIEATFGEEAKFVGFPSDGKTGNGVIIQPEVMVAIHSNSYVVSGAWDAVKTLFADEYQNKFAGKVNDSGSAETSWSFPVKKSMIDKKMEIDLMPQFWIYTDENGEEVKEEYGNTYWANGEQIELRDSTEEDTKLIYDLVTNAEFMAMGNPGLITIIEEEAAPFYDGAKSIDSVISMINSRIQLYVSERL